MKIKSLVSIVARSENAKDRRIAIRKSWSTAEREERRQVAFHSQIQLASLIALDQPKPSETKVVFEFAFCG
jgi:uncharacterized membrane protein